MIESYGADGKPESGYRGDRADGLLQDRFQGAVMGLWMVPMALRTGESTPDVCDFDAGPSFSSPGFDSCVEADYEAALFAAIISHLTEIETFLQNPQKFQSSGANADFVLSSLPVLLRFHDDSVRRCRAIFELTASKRRDSKGRDSKEREQNVRLSAQKLVLGDVLSMALSGSALSGSELFSPSSVGVSSKLSAKFPTTAALEARASDCGLSSSQHQCYQDLWQSLRGQVPQGSATSGDAVIDAIAIALTQPTDYSAAVQKAQEVHAPGYAADYSSTRSTSMRLTSTHSTSIRSNRVDTSKVDAEGIDSMLVTGIVAGALSGRKSLPVLWQMQLNMKQLDSNQPNNEQPGIESYCIQKNYRGQSMKSRQVIDIADRLFDQWAGITRKSHTIIAR